MKTTSKLHDRRPRAIVVVLILVLVLMVIEMPLAAPLLTNGTNERPLSQISDSPTNNTCESQAIPDQGGVGGTAIAVDPATGYVYIVNANDTVSVIAGTEVVDTIDLPTGGFSRLTGIDVLTTTSQVYVSQWWYDQVHVLEGTDHVATIPRDTDSPSGISDGIENGPLAIAANPVNGYVYVATSWDGQTTKNGVSVVQGSEFLAHIVTGVNPQDIVVHPDSGLVYVANGGSNTVTVIRDLEIIAGAISVGSFPRALAVHPITGYVYIVNRDSDDVTVINGTRVVARRVLVGDSPQALYIDPSSGYVYVVNRASNNVSVIEGTQVIATIPVGRNPLAVDGDLRRGYVCVANQVDGTVSVLERKRHLTDISVGQSPVALAFNPTTGSLYVVNHHSATVSLIQGQELTATISDLPRFSPVHFGVNLQTSEVYAADLAAKCVTIYQDRQVVGVVSTVTSVPTLQENPARVDYYDYTKVPQQAVVDPITDLVYVLNKDLSTVSILADMILTGTVGVGPGPEAMVQVPETGNVYVANTAGDSISVIKGVETIANIVVGPNPRALAVVTDTVYIVHEGGGTGAGVVSTLEDRSSGPRIVCNKCVTVGQIPRYVAADPVRGYVYVVNSASNDVSVLQGTRLLRRSIPVGTYPQYAVVNSKSGYAYVSNLLDGTVSVLKGPEYVATVHVGQYPWAMAVDPDTGFIYVANQVDDTVSVLDGTKVIATVKAGEYPGAIAVAPSGKIFVANYHSAEVSLFDLTLGAFEPNNTPAEAQDLSSDRVLVSQINSSTDLDWYRFYVDVPGSQITLHLDNLPLDYDVALLSDVTAAHPGEPSDTSNIGWVVEYIGQALDIGWVVEYIGDVLGLSTNRGTVPETITDIAFESGWYTVLVAGHNGVFSMDDYYSLQLEVTPAETCGETITLSFPVSIPTPSPDLNVKTVILTNLSRMAVQYPQDDIPALEQELQTLAQHDGVLGVLIRLDDYEPIRQAYEQWDRVCPLLDPQAANVVADTIKAVLTTLRDAYPNLEYIVLVGNDNVIPFRRVPDVVPLANERAYGPLAGVDSESPTNARIRQGYILTDDFYAGFQSLKWRGRSITIPEYAIGRLVEDPKDIKGLIDTYLASPIHDANKALVTGYDFLSDEASAIQKAMKSAGLAVRSLISDTWSAADLRATIQEEPDLASLNGHFTHWQAIAADGLSALSSEEIANCPADLTNALFFSVGCQSGLNIPDEDARQNAVDFPQAFANCGATSIGNTGYGYGDSDAIGYSEFLAVRFAKALLESQEPVAIGQALMQAKQTYFHSAGFASFTAYDEKSLIEATLYGLPMAQLQVQGIKSVAKSSGINLASSEPQRTDQNESVNVDLSLLFNEKTSERPSIPGAEEGVIGYYFTVKGDVQISPGHSITVEGDIQISPGRPVQPRLSVDITQENMVAHGILFLSASYTETHDFDPVISRPVTDVVNLEPLYLVDSWYPSPMHAINTLSTTHRLSQRLVVVPAQYLATTEISGTERIYPQLSYEVYYADPQITDYVPPTIRETTVRMDGGDVRFTVDVADPSSVSRVVITFDTGDGHWQRLARSRTSPGEWEGRQALPCSFRHLVQAVDTAGNVAFSYDKAVFFTPIGLNLGTAEPQSGCPGFIIPFQHTITNTGGGADTFVITAQSSRGWAVETPAPVTLGSGEHVTVDIAVRIPLAAPEGLVDEVIVKATSVSSPAVFHEIVDIATVQCWRAYLPTVLH